MKMFNLAILTGGSSGIGLAVATELVKSGTSVILIARRPGPLAEAKASLEKVIQKTLNSKTKDTKTVTVRVLALDISDPEAVNRCIPPCLDEAGVPDFLYNGAGIAYLNHFESIPLDIFRRTMDINLGGLWNILSVIIPRMKAAGGGTVVNVSSVGGFIGTYGCTAYAASKFAMMGLSQSLRNEMKPDGIDVRVLCPSDTDTPQLAEEEKTKPDETRKINGLAGVMAPEAVAKALIIGLRGRRFVIIPGFMGKLTWLAYRHFPALVHFIIDNDVRSVRRAKGKVRD